MAITILQKRKVIRDGSDWDWEWLYELSGLSTDDKPATIEGAAIGNGSTLIEEDTGDLYIYVGGWIADNR